MSLSTKRTRLSKEERLYRDGENGDGDVVGWLALADRFLEAGNERAAYAWRLRAEMADAIVAVLGDSRLDVPAPSRKAALIGRNSHTYAVRRLFGDRSLAPLGRYEMVAYRTEGHVKLGVRDTLHPARPLGLTDLEGLGNSLDRREERLFWIDSMMIDERHRKDAAYLIRLARRRADEIILWRMADDAPQGVFGDADLASWLERRGFVTDFATRGGFVSVRVHHPEGEATNDGWSMTGDLTSDGQHPLAGVWTSQNQGHSLMHCGRRTGSDAWDNPYRFLRTLYYRTGAQARVD